MCCGLREDVLLRTSQPRRSRRKALIGWQDSFWIEVFSFLATTQPLISGKLLFTAGSDAAIKSVRLDLRPPVTLPLKDGRLLQAYPEAGILLLSDGKC